MRPEDLLQIVRKQPFQPFRIHLSNGDILQVRHPELVQVGRSTALIFHPAHDQPPGVFERYDTIALVHINRIELISPPAEQVSAEG
jgi:hypothetical protein